MAPVDEPRFAGLVARQVLGLKKYVPGKPIEELQRERGLARVIKLASNENPLGPSPEGRRAYLAEAERLHRYPDGYGLCLKEAIGARWGLSPHQVVLGNGSSEIIEMTVRLLVRPGQKVVLASPSFSIYEIVVKAQGGRVVEVPLVGHGVDLDGLVAAVDGETALVIVGNPNNPTGTIFGRRAWERFLDRLPPSTGVLLDEAYAEYAWDAGFPAGRDYLELGRPLMVARTFSKLYGLAALRIGYGLASAELVDYLNRLRLPFNANGPAQAAAAAALRDREHAERSFELNRRGLEQLGAAFDRLGLSWVPSQANFVLVRVGDAARVYEALLERGVIVRPAASFGMPEWLRVTVGLPEELEVFLAAFEEVLRGGGD